MDKYNAEQISAAKKNIGAAYEAACKREEASNKATIAFLDTGKKTIQHMYDLANQLKYQGRHHQADAWFTLAMDWNAWYIDFAKHGRLLAAPELKRNADH